jgi:hypothetical protein
VPDELREWLDRVTRDFDRFRDKKAALGEIVRVLAITTCSPGSSPTRIATSPRAASWATTP